MFPRSALLGSSFVSCQGGSPKRLVSLLKVLYGLSNPPSQRAAPHPPSQPISLNRDHLPIARIPCPTWRHHPSSLNKNHRHPPPACQIPL